MRKSARPFTPLCYPLCPLRPHLCSLSDLKTSSSGWQNTDSKPSWLVFPVDLFLRIDCGLPATINTHAPDVRNHPCPLSFQTPYLPLLSLTSRNHTKSNTSNTEEGHRDGRGWDREMGGWIKDEICGTILCAGIQEHPPRTASRRARAPSHPSLCWTSYM